MRAIVRQTSEYVLGATLLGFVAAASGQAKTDILAKQITERQATISHWESLANWELSLGVLVIGLGVAVAVLQIFKEKKWCSITLIVLGAVISATTPLKELFFQVDQNTYKNYASAAKKKMELAELQLSELRADPNSKNAGDLTKVIIDLIADVGKMEDALSDAQVKGARPTTLIATAHAQSSGNPPWVSKPRAENATGFRFVGIGDDSSLTTAQVQSLQNAQRNAAVVLSIPLDSVERYATPIDTYTEYDAAGKIYRYYTLIELNKVLVPTPRPWVASTGGSVPPDSVAGGHAGNEPLYVCRASLENKGIHPGYVMPSSKGCTVPYGMSPTTVSTYEVLTDPLKQYKWVDWSATKTKVPDGAFIAGIEAPPSGRFLYICRAQSEDPEGLYPGKFDPGPRNISLSNCHIAVTGHGVYKKADYGVLVRAN